MFRFRTLYALFYKIKLKNTENFKVFYLFVLFIIVLFIPKVSEPNQTKKLIFLTITHASAGQVSSCCMQTFQSYPCQLPVFYFYIKRKSFFNKNFDVNYITSQRMIAQWLKIRRNRNPHVRFRILVSFRLMVIVVELTCQKTRI